MLSAMATPAQIEANQKNARKSTGPRTVEGKAAVAQNRTTHGLSGAFTVLPCEDMETFNALLDEYLNEYRPVTPTERFLVTELVQAQWRVMRADAIEAEVLNPGDNPTYAGIADMFRESGALDRLTRYAQTARRAFYKAQEKLQRLREFEFRLRREETRERRAAASVKAPPPSEERTVLTPMPPALQTELENHFRRDPDFDPDKDASQMSKALRRWFKNNPAPAPRGNCDSKPNVTSPATRKRAA
jgi:hypothetical protein